MKYYLIAGEASGDLHASNLMKSLRKEDGEADFRFFGGDLMQSAGGVLVKHYRDLAYMGFIPVLLHLPAILRNLRLCKKDIRNYRPDVVILVDYPGFNLKIAKYVKRKLRIPVYYYISPKVWAWKEERVKDIRKYVDKMLCIFPFETAYYKTHKINAEYVGNPTVDAIANRPYAEETFKEFTMHNQLNDKFIIALLAGSRRQEIKDNLPTMLAAASIFYDCQLVVAGAPGIDPDFYKPYLENYQANVVFDQTYRLLQQSRVALVTSGTATLETALFRIPQAVCYKTPFKRIADYIWKHFFKVKYISLVNLIANDQIVREMFNTGFSKKSIQDELNHLMHNNPYINQIQHGYQEVIRRLGGPGASDRAAKIISSGIREKISQS